MEKIKFDIKKYFVRRTGDKLNKESFGTFIKALQVPHDVFSLQALRTLNYVSSGASELGEVLVTVAKLNKNMPFDEMREEWYNIWHELAERVESQARSSAEGNHTVSAASAFLRAAEYHRQSAFFLRENLSDQRVKDSTVAAQACFQNFAKNAALNIVVADVPCEGGPPLSGYYCTPDRQDKKQRTTILMISGYDGCAEESWYSGGAAAMARGYNVLMLDGPGQGATLILKERYMQPEYEIVLDAAVKWLTDTHTKETGGLVIYARSFGGFLGARMAACSSVRLSAVVLDPFQVGFKGALSRLMLPPGAEQALIDGNIEELDALMKPALNDMPLVRFQMMSRAAVHGLSHSPGQYLYSVLNEYDISDMVKNIHCPLWTSSNPNEKLSITAGKEYASKCTIQEFSEELNGALGHCEQGAASTFYELAFDWLEDNVAP